MKGKNKQVVMLTIFCPVMSRRPEPPEAKFIPLKLLLLTAEALFSERNGGGLLL